MYIWVYLVLYGGVWLQLLLMDIGGVLQRCGNWSGSGGVALGWLRVCSHVLVLNQVLWSLGGVWMHCILFS